MNNNTITFYCSAGLMSAGLTGLQKAIQDRVNSDPEYSKKALETDEVFRKIAAAVITESRPGNGYCALWGTIGKIPQYTYIKNFEYNGVKYDIEIDLLSHLINYSD